MDNEIITEFPIKELNVILGGIKRRNIYDFRITKERKYRTDVSFELLRNNPSIGLNPDEIVNNFYDKLVGSFEKIAKGKDIRVLNYRYIYRSIKEHFDESGTDLRKVYDDKDIYEFLDFLNNNPVTARFNESLRALQPSGGGVVTFVVQNGRTGLVGNFASLNMPDGYLNNYIDIRMTPYLFDEVYIIKDGTRWIYNYPFEAMKKNDLEQAVISNNVKLFKRMGISVITDEDESRFRKNGITVSYDFCLKLDILFNDIT